MSTEEWLVVTILVLWNVILTFVLKCLARCVEDHLATHEATHGFIPSNQYLFLLHNRVAALEAGLRISPEEEDP